MREKAQIVGEQIQKEDGVQKAISFIFLMMDRAGQYHGLTSSIR